ALRRKSELDRELEDELQFHLARETAQNLHSGMSPEVARYASMRSFGGIEQAKEECRDARGVRLIEDLSRDISYGTRSLWKNRGFTLVAVLTLALGIGANTGVFSLTNALLLRAPNGVSKPEEVVIVGRTFSGSDFNTFSYPDYVDCRDQNQSFSDLA